MPKLSWHNAGDSYSSGEGVSGNVGACAQSGDAYGPKAAALVRAKGWTVDPLVFTACTGHLVEDFLNARPASDKKSLLDWAKEQGLGDGRADVVTLSFGGNDIGFAQTIVDCLRSPLEGWVVGGLGGGCDESEADLDARVDALLSPTKKCTGGRLDTRRDASFAWGCDLLLDGRATAQSGDDVRGSIVDFYKLVVDRHLTDRGRLYVVGYPSVFAPTSEWGSWNAFACADVTKGDADKLARVAEHFNTKLRDAVTLADGGRGRIVYISRYDMFREGSHELCGRGQDWINGVSKNRGPGVQWARYDTSFHPNAAGHAPVAQAVADQVSSASWPNLLPAVPQGRSREALALILAAQPDSLDACWDFEVHGADLAAKSIVFERQNNVACGGDAASTVFLVTNGHVDSSATACGDCEADIIGEDAKFEELVKPYASRKSLDLHPWTQECKPAGCAVTGAINFLHPAWGPVTLATLKWGESTCSSAELRVFDASGNQRWSRPLGGCFETLKPGEVPIDKLGHVFVDYNPGRYNGVIVLNPSKQGFQDFGSLPPPDDYAGRWYYAESSDINKDGVREIVQSNNDCEPDCAGGTITSQTFSWNGSDYAPG